MNRSHLEKLALESYRTLKHPRDYALTNDAKDVLAVLAAAVLQKRAAENRTDSDKPTVRQEIAGLIQKLSDAGCNVLQRRPTDAPPTPKPWTDPVTGAQLPNPFAKGSADLKAQTILQQRDPRLAEHYKAMATDPYGYLSRLQDEQVERESLGAVPYDSEIHKLNPFLGDNLRAQDEFFKRDPKLAEFYRAEAQPVEIPVFGKNRNLTIEGRLHRDLHAASVLKIANALQAQWLAADRQSAAEAKTKAEAEIARLEQQIA
jgi:hypothetical protein